MNKLIVIEKRSCDYMAYIENDKTLWGCGKNINSAIGNLVSTHSDKLNLDLIFK